MDFADRFFVAVLVLGLLAAGVVAAWAARAFRRRPPRLRSLIIAAGAALVLVMPLGGCARVAKHETAIVAGQTAQAEALAAYKTQVRADLRALRESTASPQERLALIQAYEKAVHSMLPLLKAVNKTMGAALDATLDDGASR